MGFEKRVVERLLQRALDEFDSNPMALQFIIDAPTRKAGSPNTYVIGQQRLQQYGQMLMTCWKARISILQAGHPEVGRGPGAPQ